jgi:hypothetical protein
VRIVRLECRQIGSRLGEMSGDLDQPRLDFFFRHILLAKDFEKLGDSGLSEAQLRGQFSSFCLSFGLGLGRSRHLIGKGLRHCRQNGWVLVVDDNRAALDVASYGYTAWSRDNLLPGARIDYSDNETKCCAEDTSQPTADPGLTDHLPGD